MSASAFARRRPEFGDALLFPYIAVFARQCFWAVENDLLAWALTLAASALVWLLHLRFKPSTEERTPRLFWLAVALPLLFVFTLRAAFPDLSFDVLNHRLIQSERALRGEQLLPGDFFPTIFPFNPAPDMLTGVFRHLLGYRLGTIVNLLALVWAGTVLEKILRPFVTRAGWRCAGVLAALFTEHVLFQVNNYMVDLLALPLVLEALRLALEYEESEHKQRDLLVSALLLGASVGLKLTNAAVALPVLSVFAVRILRKRPDARTAWLVLLSAVLFILPALPHALYIYAETGSPVFPLYNNFIHSPLWPDMTPYDGRWGPRDLSETLIWPVLSAWKPERLSELGVYSGRIALGAAAALLCLVLPRVDARARLIALAVLLGSLLWASTSGYVRYALFCEITGGVLLVYLARHFAAHAERRRALKLVAAAVPLCLLLAQCVLGFTYVLRTEWSKRPTYFDDWAAYRRELRWAWRDRDLDEFQTVEARALFARVEAWVVSDVKTNGVQVLLRPNVPMLAVNNPEYFDQRPSRTRFAGALERSRGRRVYSLSLTEDLDTSLAFLERRRFSVAGVTPVLVSFYSARTRLHMQLIELGLPEERERARKPPDAPLITETDGPLDDDAYEARLSVTDAPARLRAGEQAAVRVSVTNASDFVWPARGQKDGKYFINVADAWLDGGDESLVNNLDGRTTLPRDLWPGETIELPLTVRAPAEPGEYLLEIDLVQEGVTFFKAKGSQYPRYKVKVE